MNNHPAPGNSHSTKQSAAGKSAWLYICEQGMLRENLIKCPTHKRWMPSRETDRKHAGRIRLCLSDRHGNEIFVEMLKNDKFEIMMAAWHKRVPQYPLSMCTFRHDIIRADPVNLKIIDEATDLQSWMTPNSGHAWVEHLDHILVIYDSDEPEPETAN